MTRIDIISGFLGAGKTSFIKKLLENGVNKDKTVLIENEYGEIGIDGGFLKDSGIEIREMMAGCICCSLQGDFTTSLQEILTTYKPERVIIEPSGVGKLSDIIKAVQDVESDLNVTQNFAITVVDAKKAKIYAKNFGEFFDNQIRYAKTIVLSRTDILDAAKISEAVEIVKAINPNATIITTPVKDLSAEKLVEILESPVDLEEELLDEMRREAEHHHEHHDHGDHAHDETCGCGEAHHHHDHGDHAHGETCGCGEAHHHDHGDHAHDETCGCGEAHHHDHGDHAHGETCGCGEAHHHDHGETCGCGHDHHDHHHHHAEDVFDSFGLEQVPAIDEQRLKEILENLKESTMYGTVLRAKGMLPVADSKEWLYFDLVPGEMEIRKGSPDYTGKVCVIGTGLKKDLLEKEFKQR